jgi:outer membrane lipoprotein carrier protein
MTIMRVLAVAGVAAVIAAPAGAQDKPVDRAVAAWKTVKSLSGTFEQTITNPLLRQTMTARGTYAQQRPNKLAVRFTEPAGDAIISDGSHLWVFLQQAAPGQVIKRRVDDRMASPIDIGQFLDAPATKYEMVAKGADRVGERPAQAVALSPKKGVDAPFTKATVWIDDADGMIRQFEVTETTGVVRRIRLLTLRANPTIPASEFKFAVPKGIRVVDR